MPFPPPNLALPPFRVINPRHSDRAVGRVFPFRCIGPLSVISIKIPIVLCNYLALNSLHLFVFIKKHIEGYLSVNPNDCRLLVARLIDRFLLSLQRLTEFFLVTVVDGLKGGIDRRL